MSDPYIPPDDRIDVIGRLNERLEDAGDATLREKAEAAAFAEAPFNELKTESDPKEGKETKEEPVKDGGGKDTKETKEVEKEEDKENKEHKEFKEGGGKDDKEKEDKEEGKDTKDGEKDQGKDDKEKEDKENGKDGDKEEAKEFPEKDPFTFEGPPGDEPSSGDRGPVEPDRPVL